MMMGLTSPPYHNRNGASRRRLLTSTATPKNSKTIINNVGFDADVDADAAHPKNKRNANNTTSKVTLDASFTNTQTHYGLLITLDPETNQLCLQFCPDRNLREIHPNSYGPAAMTNVHKLGGGGSGVAVFAGHHEELGDVVMKHGSDKDLTELFALSTVAQELKQRGTSHKDAAKHIQQRIPAFRMIYISPHHLGEKRKELWNRLRDISRINDTIILLPIDEMMSFVEEDESTSTTTHNSPTSWRSYQDPQLSQTSLPQFADDDEDEIIEAEESFRMLKNCSILDQYNLANQAPDNLPPGVEISKSGTFSGHREIAIVTSSHHHHHQDQVQVQLKGESLMFVLPAGRMETDNEEDENSHTRKIRIKGDGYQALQSIYVDLLALMKSHKWKFTLGQKLIGGSNPQTGNEWLYANRLRGPVLNNLVTQKINLVLDLVRLTTLDEQDPKVLERIREETKRITQEKDRNNAAELSVEADAFVGNAIRKNFRHGTGRIPMLMLLGKHFREHTDEKQQQKKATILLKQQQQHQQPHKGPHLPRGNSFSSLILQPEEMIPAFHLGNITNPGALMGNTFERAPMEPTVLESMSPQYWPKLLSNAVSETMSTASSSSPQKKTKTNTMVWKRLWTCGLADAGLHNLFCSDSRLWLFDLGEPQLTSVPGFLTKFLFSFFHTLGMQEPPTDSTIWVRRFDHNKRSRKLQLTSATSKLLSQAYAAFALAMDRIVQELFNGDDSVRWLLLQYVTLQLVSDASFCLQKWTIKGGGRARDSNHQEGLEKWLWRALWDIYVACDINSQNSLRRLKVQPKQADDFKIISPTLRDRQMALIQELALETTRLEEVCSEQSNDKFRCSR